MVSAATKMVQDHVESGFDGEEASPQDPKRGLPSSMFLCMMASGTILLFYGQVISSSRHEIAALRVQVQDLQQKLMQQRILSETPTTTTRGDPGGPSTQNGGHPAVSRGDDLVTMTPSGSNNSQNDGLLPMTRRKRDALDTHTEPAVKAIHLVNVKDTVISSKGGYLPHWRIDLRLNELDSFRLVEHSDFALGGTYSHFMALEDGLYQVYAQLYFESSANEWNSYDLRASYGPRNDRTLATCSVVAPAGEGTMSISCFTSIVTTLKREEMVSIFVDQPGRKINAEDGKTFWGIVRLG